MLNVNFAKPRSLLLLGAHADDIEIGCGATLLRLLDQSPELAVNWVVFSASPQRRQEAALGAELFLKQCKSTHVMIHEFEDSFFPYQGEEIKRLFHQLAREVQPDLIFTHRRDDAHQDHRTIAELTWCAFRNHQILEYEIPKYEGDLGNPNLFFSAEESLCQKKVEILTQAYPSQQEKHWFTPDVYWSVLRLRGVECCSPTRYAEGFYARKLVC
jgi:LmbE family N-acetylglucosaminyl deacetylase